MLCFITCFFRQSTLHRLCRNKFLISGLNISCTECLTPYFCIKTAGIFIGFSLQSLGYRIAINKFRFTCYHLPLAQCLSPLYGIHIFSINIGFNCLYIFHRHRQTGQPLSHTIITKLSSYCIIFRYTQSFLPLKHITGIL